MGKSNAHKILAVHDGELLGVLRYLHYCLLCISPYDAVAREAWFDEVHSLLPLANDTSEQAEWVLSLAWAYKQHLGQGMPLCMITGRLLNGRENNRFMALHMTADLTC